MTDAVTPEDARRIARALVGDDPTPEEIERWRRAVEQVAPPLATARDRALWAWARRGAPWTGLVDAGLALVEPWSDVRHRLYLLLAVLEASPSHVDRFEVRDVSAAAAVVEVVLAGARGLLRSVLGVAWVLVLRTVAR